MGSLFAKKKKPETESRVTEQDKAVLELKQQRDKLKVYQKKIAVQLEKERQLARQFLKDGKRDKAKLLLRKKRFQENLITKTDGALENIERMVQDIEFAQIEVKVVEGLANGNNALKKMHRLLSLEDVEKIMDETQEGVEYQQEIDDILAGGLTKEDEDDVLDELNQIMGETASDKTPVQEDVQLPDVPTNKIKEPESEREKEAVLAS